MKGVIHLGKAKEFLRDVRRMELTVQSKLEQLDKIRRDMTTIKAVDYSKQKLDGGDPAGAHYESLAARLIDEEARINEVIDSLSDLREQATRIIDRMEDRTEAAVLTYYYIGGCTWEETAEKAYVALRSVYYIHGRALYHFEELMD